MFKYDCSISQAGTTRLSSHVPGYMGHVPSYTVGVAAEQGLGQTKRDTFLGPWIISLDAFGDAAVRSRCALIGLIAVTQSLPPDNHHHLSSVSPIDVQATRT